MAVVIRLEFVVCWVLAEALQRRSNLSDPTGIDEGRDGSIAATPLIPGEWWYSAALSEFGPPFLNGAQRSVNRKVQGSNPCPGAKIDLKWALWLLSACPLLQPHFALTQGLVGNLDQIAGQSRQRVRIKHRDTRWGRRDDAFL